MSLWQHKNIHKRHLLWAKIFGICLLFHAIFLFLALCVYRDNTDVIALSINKKMDYSAPIMFIPFAEIKKPIVAVKPQPAVQKTAPVKSATTIKAEPAKVAVLKTVEPKPEIKPEVKPEVEKVDVQKPEIEKPIAPTIEPAVVKKEIIPPTQPILEKKLPEIPAIAKALDIQNAPIIPIIPENAIVSNDYREVEALRRGAQLQKELVNVWKPPMGVSPDCVCEIAFYVTKTGTLENLNITKKSGVMMYDISARNALYAMKMPRWTYDKPFTITFKQ